MTQDVDTKQQAETPTQRRVQSKANLSSDGKWKSFPKVQGLLQYVPSGVYYGRVKAGGKLIRQSLETDVFETARMRLADFIKDRRKRAARPVSGTFGEARALYEADIESDHTLKEGSKGYRQTCVKALLRSWPELDGSVPNKITETQCREWAGRFATECGEQFFNNTLGSFRKILERAGIGRDDNPAYKVKRLGVKQKELKLPEASQFGELVRLIETAGARQSRDCADLVMFLAYSGCRISESRQVKWGDVDLEREQIRVQTAKRSKTSGTALARYVPIIPPMRNLLDRLRRSKPSPEATVCRVKECQKSVTRACRLLKISRFTHHDLRHLFATRCIESGVDIPTVSRWLGHSDGGALAMKTYGHLRREHSAAMAQRVTFATPQSATQSISATRQ